ncbi:MAG: Lipopolysaccharide core heptosyltransferase RfaQ [Ignavibacteria bacterium]|nr:Lipopolysaccharide core heptosyltransferase RfaQ [Ignavibacteria bacterium]
MSRYLILQTAFLGDVILTLPLIRLLKDKYPDSKIDFMCIPETSELLRDNPLIDEVIVYDKKNSGLIGFFQIAKNLRNRKYDAIISPHRSFRSAFICSLSGSKNTISFNKSSMSFLYKHRIKYDASMHEIQRNISLLQPLGIVTKEIVRPEIFISQQDIRKIDSIFYGNFIKEEEKIMVIAPGTVWFTKRFPESKFIKLCDLFASSGIRIFLIGSKKDKVIADFIVNNSKNKSIINVTGTLTIIESAELIRRASLLVTNDSAPMHIANAVGTNVIAIFGATVPSFGFYPYGKNDFIFETNGLKCRPCSIHGGNKCPIKTFDCMNRIDEKEIYNKTREYLC